jgi:hypothetical protein
MVFSPLLKGEPLKDSDLFVGNTTFRRAVLCRCSIHPTAAPRPATAGAQRASTTGRTGPQGCRCRRALPRTALLVHEREPRNVAAVDPGRDFMVSRVPIVPVRIRRLGQRRDFMLSRVTDSPSKDADRDFMLIRVTDSPSKHADSRNPGHRCSANAGLHGALLQHCVGARRGAAASDPVDRGVPPREPQLLPAAHRLV